MLADMKGWLAVTCWLLLGGRLLVRLAFHSTPVHEDSSSVMIHTLIAFLFLLGSTLPAMAQPTPPSDNLAALPNAPITLHRLTAPIALDGRSNEAAWQAIPPLPLTMYRPTFEGDPTERTEIRVAYDEDFLYFAGRFYDSDPDGIRANTLYRDGFNDSDAFTVIVDPFNDNVNARMFWTTPAGLRADQAIAADGRTHNANWNTYWDVVTQQDASGWYAEMRIPFSSLGFKSSGGDATMGLIVSRLIARKNEELIFPAISPSWSISTPSKAADVLLEGIQSQNPVYVTPYALGGLGQRYELNEVGPAYVRNDDATWDLGVDVKYNLTSTLTFDATVNTDFAQAEADNQQVNLTRFSLFFPEKRQFFQERAGLFEFTTSNERLFHSRRIGLVQGEAVPILGGARLVGRVGAWDVGLLDMQTAETNTLGVPSENFGVLRLQRQVLNPYSTAGGIFTSRIGTDGTYNVAYGLDADLRVVDDEYLRVKWAQTVDDAVLEAGSFDAVAASLVEVEWQKRRLQGWSYRTSLTRMGADFQPDLGFVTRRDNTEIRWLLHHNAFPGAESPFARTMLFHVNGNIDWRNEDGSVESAAVYAQPFLWWKGGAAGGLLGVVNYEDLQAPLRLPKQAEVAVGSYTFGQAQLHAGTSAARWMQANGFVAAGTFYDGWRADFSLAPVWNASRHLRLTPGYQLTRIRFPDRDQGFDAHLARVRIE